MLYPRNKRYNHKSFTTENFYATCASFSRNRYGFAHECTLYFTDSNGNTKTVEGLAKWCNRTWECFKYESCLKDAISELPAELQKQATEELINDTKKAEHEKAESFVNAFKTQYEKLPQSTKEILKNVTLQDEQQAKSLLGFMICINLLNE